ncbi:nuclear transport factor 2 family protein [Nocardia rhamnosiphila]
MKLPPHCTPEQFVHDFFVEFTAAALTDADPAEVVDRFHTPDIEQISDGIRLNRDRLAAHLRPLRKNLREYRFDVHRAIADGRCIAAHLTIHARMRNGSVLATEVFQFGRYAPDGRLRRAEQITRTLTHDS